MVAWVIANFQYSRIGPYNSFLLKNRVGHTYSSSSCAPFGIGRNKARNKMTTQAMNNNDSSSNSGYSPKFESSMWGYHFLSYASQLTEITTQEKLELEELKESVRKMLVETPDESREKLVLIDAIQRLGVAYHFNNEMETSIHNIFEQRHDEINEDNLNVVALRFRLMRQQGHYMSSDVFKQFTNHDGKFKETLANDVQGLLSLYEAAHLRVHDEEILEEALTFTTNHLESMVPNLSNSLKLQVTEALSQPIRKTVPRVGARKYILIYEDIEKHNDLLLKFAKLDFNRLQKLYQKELSELTRWWKDLDIAKKLPYAKDRFVEAYFWIVGMCFEPQFGCLRRMLTKVFNLNSIIDDTYDSYGTFDELVLFTNAIERWDIGAMNSLPPYLKLIYQAVLDIYDEMEEVLSREGKSNMSICYAENEMKKLARAYLKEAEWLNAGYNPKCDEYITNALRTSTCMLYVITSLVGVEELITKETFEWITNWPLIVRATSVIARFTDDIADHEDEHQREHDPSIVECYMKDYGASKEEAYIHIRKEITNAWKDINKDFLCPMEVPIVVLERTLIFAQMIDTFFKGYQDGYKRPKSEIKDLITLFFVESVKI